MQPPALLELDFFLTTQQLKCILVAILSMLSTQPAFTDYIGTDKSSSSTLANQSSYYNTKKEGGALREWGSVCLLRLCVVCLRLSHSS